MRTLALHGDYEFVEAGSASEAVKKIGRSLPNLIILDIGLGAENGLDLLRSLKENDKTAGIPVIVCSADSKSATIEWAESLGAAGYVPKPINAKVLQSQVRQILNPREED